LLCNRALKGEINAKFVPLGAAGMALFSADLVLASARGAPAADGALMDLVGFLSAAPNWRILVDLLMLAICGGFYIVPLYAILQTRTEEQHRARTIAANNIMNALFMVIAAAATSAMLAMSFSVTQVFLVVAIGNVVVAVYICRLLPGELIKALGRRLFRLAYRVEIKGWENYRRAGEKVVIVANHTSFLDAALLCAFLPETPTFAINSLVARRWWVQPAFHLFDLLPLDPTNPMAAKTMVRVIKEGRKLLIFPEGRITVTGALMKVYEGPGAIADLADAQFLPIRIDGAQYTKFSRLKGKVHRRWFPKISITILPPRRFEVPEDLKGRARRQALGNQLYDLMADMIYETEDVSRSLFDVLTAARRVHGGGSLVLEDIERKPMSYDGLIRASLALGRRLSRLAGPGECVGILLPNSVATVVAFMALQAFGRVPAMLNFSTGTANMVSACGAARIGAVVTSRRFIELAKLEEAAEALSRDARLVYLDDLRPRLGVLSKLFGLLAGPFAGWVHKRLTREATADAPAVVLFTSGSEGTPKGVVLSHRNLLANRVQLSARIDFNPTDRVFNVLPVFHSFGLTGGLLLPLLSGIQTFLYPSPLHYRIVPELVYDQNATILFGTDTFLAGYARAAHPYDFYSLRYVFAGAERLREETRRVWAEKFGLRIFEGYGATETGPALATNTPMHYKAGTVGRFLPGIRHRLEPVPGVAEGGRLQVQGRNIMLGYLLSERPGKLEPPADGWYDTGDIVSIDPEGYITIQGRAKRFAKVAGEMVSLTAVEEQVASLWPEHRHAVVAFADARKGEQLALVTENDEADRAVLQAHIQANGGSELMIPRHILPVESLPLLGTGKTDYAAVQALAAPLES
jgi:acyl-[acyl-carrier-protein]-phospholipid O-acyltransferase/long-chain-fatty-acid--[acyl-carrier-protein] ligase